MSEKERNHNILADQEYMNDLCANKARTINDKNQQDKCSQYRVYQYAYDLYFVYFDVDRNMTISIKTFFAYT